MDDGILDIIGAKYRSLLGGIVFLTLGLSCRSGGVGLDAGKWGLRTMAGETPVIAHGPTPGGEISVNSAGCGGSEVSVALWSGGLVTPGGEAVAAVVSEAAGEGEYWLTVPVETGVGDGEASIWWSPAAGLARLPLGGRPGELEIQFEVTTEPVEDASSAALAAVIAERDAWAEGAFLLEDAKGRNVGVLKLLGAESAPRIGVWDALWLSNGLVPALRADDGGDLILQFDVEPSIQSETAMLRINVVTRNAVIPAAPTPSELDRWIVLRPGTLTEDQIDDAIDDAIDRADAAERAWVEELGPKLARALYRDGECLAPDAVEGGWPLLLAGYTVRTAVLEHGCAVAFEPNPIQHRRRFRGWVSEAGILPRDAWPPL